MTTQRKADVLGYKGSLKRKSLLHGLKKRKGKNNEKHNQNIK